MSGTENLSIIKSENPTIYGPKAVISLEDKRDCIALADRIGGLAAVAASSAIAEKQPQLQQVFLAIEAFAKELVEALDEKTMLVKD